MSKASVCKIIKETCQSIIDNLSKTFIKTPDTEQDWREIARKFGINRQFKQCTGCLDSKHVRICKPNLGCSKYFNYKRYHSIHLFALVDSEYNFMYVRIGDQGSIPDSNILSRCSFTKRLNDGLLSYPNDTIDNLPFTFIADGGFTIAERILVPYNKKQTNTHQKKVFNYRLSRTRRVIENVFGVLTHRFRVMFKCMSISPKTATLVVGAACVLHNLLNQRNPKSYCMKLKINKNELKANDNLKELEVDQINEYNHEQIRIRFAKYFFNENTIEEQWKVLF